MYCAGGDPRAARPAAASAACRCARGRGRRARATGAVAPHDDDARGDASHAGLVDAQADAGGVPSRTERGVTRNTRATGRGGAGAP